MSLVEMQRCFTRLLTDSGFRARLLVSADDALAEYKLTQRERRSLAAMDHGRLVATAQFWERGRLGTAMSAFPLSEVALGREWAGLAEAYCAERPAPRTRVPGRERMAEAEDAHEFLMARWRDGRIGPNYLGALLDYEMATYRLFSSPTAKASARVAGEAASAPPLTVSTAEAWMPCAGDHVEVRTFDFNVVSLATRLQRGEIPTRAEAQAVTLVLVLQPSGRRVTTLRVDAVVAALVAACDGRRPSTDVVASVDGLRHPAGDASADAGQRGMELLNELRAKGALAFRER